MISGRSSRASYSGDLTPDGLKFCAWPRSCPTRCTRMMVTMATKASKPTPSVQKARGPARILSTRKLKFWPKKPVR